MDGRVDGWVGEKKGRQSATWAQKHMRSVTSCSRHVHVTHVEVLGDVEVAQALALGPRARPRLPAWWGEGNWRLAVGWLRLGWNRGNWGNQGRQAGRQAGSKAGRQAEIRQQKLGSKAGIQ